MKNILKYALLAFSMGGILLAWHAPAEAAWRFTTVQVPMPVEFAMSSTPTPTITYRVSNTSTAGEAMTAVRFNLANNAYTTFPNPESFVAPTGWTCARTSNTRLTCTASNATYYIPAGSSQNFTFTINNVAMAQDRTDQLSNSNARFSGSNTWRTNTSLSSSWTWKALLMTLVPLPTGVGSGCQFTLTMTVTNKSTANGLVITSIPKPPQAFLAGATVSTLSNPANLTLNAGATGTMIWTYTITGLPGNSVTFQACASTGASCTTVSGTTRTSSTITSSPVAVVTGASCGLSATLVETPTCLYSGDIATIQMVVKNTTGITVNNVVPSALTSVVTGSAAFGSFTGPAPATIVSIATGATGTFTWTAAVTGNPNDTYAVSGFATASGPITTPTTTSNVQDIDGYIVTVSPTSTNANSTNVELVWHIQNFGCSNANQVSIAVPAGWTFANDAYALVNNTAGAQVDTWTVAGTTLTSPNATDRMPPAPATNTGDFSLLFSQSPSATGDYVFNVTITDDALPPVIRVKQTTVTVNPFGSGSLNSTDNTIWHENAP